MDKPKSSSQPSSLDSLRTVEFRQTLRGYHIDDVDEYLERVAVDAEALQEQFRQAGERVKQAADRIAQLERQLQQGPPAQGPPAQGQPQPAASPSVVGDETLQRTLVLAQKFVEQTHADAESQARILVSEAEERARTMVEEAEHRARSVTADTERRLRDEIVRLETTRTKLASDVETIARHLDNERTRLRDTLANMLSWVDENVQPAASLLVQPPDTRRDDAGPGPSSPEAAKSDAASPPASSLPERSTVRQSENAATGERATEAMERRPERPGFARVVGEPDGARAGSTR